MSEGRLGLFLRMEEEQEVLDATVSGLGQLLQRTERERWEREAEHRRSGDAVALRVAAHRRERASQLQHVVIWRNRPYYARFDIQGDGSADPETYYLSEVLDESTDTTGAGGARMIHWTVPLARAFAEQPQRVRVGSFRGSALLKRRFEVRDLTITDMGDSLSAYAGGETVGGDPFLGRVLTMAGPRAGNIVRTIGRLQSEIVFDRTPLLVIHGVPGSGKTQIGQMRIACLVTDATAERSRRLAAENCLILSPSQALVEYMEAVLPSFGVRGVQQASLGAWLASYAGIALPTHHSSPERGRFPFGSALEGWLADQVRSGVLRLQTPTPPGPEGWKVADEDVALALEAIGQDSHAGIRRMIAQRLARRAKEDALRGLRSGWDEAAMRAFRAREAEIDRAAQRFVAAAWPPLTPVQAYRAFLQDMELDREMGEEDLPALCLLRWRLTGQRPPSVRHIVVDEGQNVSALGYLALHRLAPEAGITVLGDLAQRDPQLAGLSDWSDLEGAGLGPPEVRYLGVNYRSAPSIVAVLNAIGSRLCLPFVAIEAVERPAPPVLAFAIEGGEEARDAAVTHLLCEFPHSTCAILCRDGRRARSVASALRRRLPAQVREPFVGTRADAAGLEFDLAIIEDASVRSFPEDADAASDLFVMASRAQNRLILLHSGELTGLLDRSLLLCLPLAVDRPLPGEVLADFG